MTGKGAVPMKLSRIDLHMHSTVSDGTDTPLMLLERAISSGLLLFSLTDHDAISGNREILSGLKALGHDSSAPHSLPCFITGVEFSCRDEFGKYHILGYGFDPDHPAINEVVEAGHNHRITLMKERIDFLRNEFSVEITDEEEKELFSLSNPGKPHLARLLFSKGYCRTKDEAFDNFLNKIPEKNRYLRPEDAIEGIMNAGGRAILAHPFYGASAEWICGQKLEDRVKRLKDLGLSGLECFHSDLTYENTKEVLSLAEKYDLLITAGSDYHGDNKDITLGTISKEETPYTDAFSKGDMNELPERIVRFLESIA